MFLHAAGTGTRIELGCHAKVPFEIGAVMSNAHDACEAAIRAALTIPSARVV